MTEKRLTSRDLARTRTREALLAAAEKLVAERGFGGVSVGDVATAAGYTKGAFYSNFKSREAILLELLRRLRARHKAVTQASIAAAASDLPQTLDRLAELAMRHAISPTSSLLIAEVQLQARRDPAFSAEVKAGFEHQVGAFAGWIDRFAKEGNLRLKMSSRQLARTILALSQGLAQQPADRNEVKKIMRDVLGRLFGQ